MTDISDLEQRISAALDRIGTGLSELATPTQGAVDDTELTTLQEALEEERTANAQLEERVRAIRRKQERLVGSLRNEVEELREQVAGRTADTQRLETVNAQLRSNNQALRQANESGLGDSDLINSAMAAELDSLRASRGADRTELDTILSELKPLVEGKTDA